MPCPSCGAAVSPGSRFCPSCGHSLSVHLDERRVVTVLFGDLVGFTSLAESLDPEAVKVLVDGGFERLVRDIVEFGGRVDKILGDAIVALFGAPIAHEDDPERAVRAALAMQNTMRAYAAEVGANIQMRIGVNTGEVLTGAMRAGGEYTAMGDVVNTASRLQSAARPGHVLVGPLTYEATRDVIAFEPVGAVQARGREEPVEAHRAVDVLLLPGRRPRRRHSPLVGRDPDLALLRDAISLAYAQHRTLLVLVLGEAGVGKTRLADEVAAWAQLEKGARMVESHCVPYGEANIWFPLGVALRGLCAIGEDTAFADAREQCTRVVADALDTPADGQLAQRTAGALLYLMGYEGPLRELEPQRARDEAARALTRFLEGLAQRQPLLFRLADLHWADDLVLELVDDVVDGVGRSPLVLIATARHLLDARWAPRVGRHNILVISLDPLDTVAASQLLDQLLRAEIDEETRGALLDRSGGNPFFLEELVALLERRETTEAGLPDLAAAAAEQELPETLRGLIAARLDRLSPDERLVLDNAAVLGRSGPLQALAKVSEATGMASSWRAAFDSLVDRELLTLAGGRWAFHSDLVREVAYGTLTKSDRARRHAEIADWMEQNLPVATDDGAVDRVAYHYAQAAMLARELGFAANLPVDLRDRALRWLGEAGRRAKKAEVHLLAARLFSQALELAGFEPSPERLEFLIGRAEARFGLFELAGARVDVAEAIALAEQLDDLRGRTRAQLVLGEIEQREGDIDAALRILEEALAQFRALSDRRGEAEALRLLGMTRLFGQAYSAAEASTSEALTIFRELGDRRGEAWALQNLAWISYLDGRVSEAEVRIDESAATFTELGDSGGLGWANALLAFTRFHQGRFAEAELLAEEILPDARARGDRFGEGMMLLLTALVRMWSGRIALAVERADEARNLFARVGDPVSQVQSQVTFARATVAAGRVEHGFAALDEALSLARRTTPPSGLGLAATVAVASAVHLGEPDRAVPYVAVLATEEAAGDPIGSADRQAALALYHLQCGEPETTLAMLGPLADAPAADVSPGTMTALALAFLASGDADNALAQADRAHESRRATYLDLTYSYLAAGLAHALRGDVSEVIAAFSSARQEVDHTGDVVGQAVVRLAESHALTSVGATSARAVRREAERRLADLGIKASGWSTVFSTVERHPGPAPAR